MIFDIPVVSYKSMAINVYVDGERSKDIEEKILTDLVNSGLVMKHSCWGKNYENSN